MLSLFFLSRSDNLGGVPDTSYDNSRTEYLEVGGMKIFAMTRGSTCCAQHKSEFALLRGDFLRDMEPLWGKITMINLLDLPLTRPRVLSRYHIMVPRGSMEECRCLGSYLVGQAPIHCFSPRVGFDYLRQMVENVSLALEVENGGAAAAFFQPCN